MRRLTSLPLVLAGALLLTGAGPAGIEWRRAPEPVLTATLPWEDTSVAEPTVWHEDGRWHMIYTGGWETAALGYATADRPGGPWVKRRSPIVGMGGAGWAGSARHSSIYREGGRVWVYFSPGITDEYRADTLMVATGRSVTDLRVLSRPALLPTGKALGIVNTAVVRTGKGYALVYESDVADQHVHWRTGLATGSTPASFTSRVFPLRSLAKSDTGTFGGPAVHRRSDGTWVMWYHAAVDGVTPTRLYRATSPDLRSWTSSVRPKVGLVAGYEVDQVADPFRVRDGGRTFLFWSGMDNPNETGVITFARRHYTAS